MFRLVHSNQLEALAERLAETLRESAPAPLASEIIVVPSAGVGRWLGFTLADRLGIVAGIKYPFPAAYVWALFTQVLPDLPRASPFDPAVLTWRLMRLLARERRDPALAVIFAPVASYLENDSVTARYELASALADRFDAYAAYRPHWLEGWLDGRNFNLGEHEGWQSALWRALAAEQTAIPHAHPRHAFFERLRDDPRARALLPSRLSLFGVEALAPLYLDIVKGLAEYIDVTVYLPSPSREYWADIVTRAAQARAARRDPEHAEHREVRNRLLAALGAHGRAFFDHLIALESDELPCYVEPNRPNQPKQPTLLARLQHDMLDLDERHDFKVAPDDQSIAIHVCHGPIREAEVLHDQLLARFEADPTLAPEDVLVLVPEIDRYGGAFDAVFSSVPRERFIPFTIADRVGAVERPLVRSVLALIDVGLGRLDAESVLALLDEPRIARRFDIEAHDLSRLRRWVDATGIRWGADERAKKRLDLPATRMFTWRAGLDRLILGAAMAPASADDTAPIAGIVPFDDIEGAGMALVGALDRLLETLARLAADFERPRPIAAWCTRVTSLIGEFHQLDTADAEDANAVRDALGAVADAAIRAEDREPIPATLARRPIEQALEALGGAGHFLGGGVTIARLALGRVIPARIVCVVGLNDGVFPAADRERGFDLMRGHRAPGDRSRRDEDRYAFLGAINAAREAIIVTYTGLSARDTVVRPPSMVLNTLLETIRASTERSMADDVLEQITVTHPLHPTSPRYGGKDDRLFTYAAEWRASAAPPAQTPFAEGLRLAVVADESDDLRVIELGTLEQFIVEPVRYTLRHGLGLTLNDEDARIDAVEPFTLDGLERHALRDDLLEGFLGGRDPERMNATLASTGRAPEGPVGAALLAREAAVAAEIADAVKGAVDVTLVWAPPLRLDLTVEVMPRASEARWWRVRGQLDRWTSGGQVVATAARINARRILIAWVRHLGLNAAPVLAATADALARRTFLVGRPTDPKKDKLAVYEFRAMTLQAATAALAALLELVTAAEAGFVPFYADAAFAFYAAELAGNADPFDAAHDCWTPDAFARRAIERERSYVALATRDDPTPFTAAFAALARRVFAPLDEQSDVFDSVKTKVQKNKKP